MLRSSNGEREDYEGLFQIRSIVCAVVSGESAYGVKGLTRFLPCGNECLTGEQRKVVGGL